jgi:putative flippase GtrA
MVGTFPKKTGYMVISSGLILVFIFLAVTSLLRKSPTCDETGHHIGSGYVFLTKGDFAFSTEVPPLSRYLMALPLLTLDLDLPDNRDFWAREDRGEFVQEFVFGINRDNAGKIVFLARLPMVVLGALGGLFLFLWTKRHYGPKVALIAAALYFLSPNLIAHSRLATTDIAATVFIMCSVMSFWDLLCVTRPREGLIAGVFLALALLSKYTALLLIPVYILMLIARSFYMKRDISGSLKDNNVVRSFLVMFSIAFFALWAGYLFETKPLLDGVLRAGEKEILFLDMCARVFPAHGETLLRNARYFLYNFPIPLRSFIIGVAGIVRHSTEGASTYFMGSWSGKGHPFYYIVAFFIKTPLPVIIGFITGAYFAFKEKKNRALNTYLIFFVVLFFIVASRSNLQLGLRYVLPVYPLIFIISAVGIGNMLSSRAVIKAFGIGLIMWMAAIHFFIWPDYLSYFNELIGGSGNGHLYLRDSNIDWGQDLPALKKYMDNNGIEEVKLLYFGTADPSYYGIRYMDLDNSEFKTPGNEIYAVSVHYLEAAEWTKAKVPTGIAGRSIFIYDLR